MTPPRCYFCGRRIGPRIGWMEIPRPDGFSIYAAVCKDCEKKEVKK